MNVHLIDSRDYKCYQEVSIGNDISKSGKLLEEMFSRANLTSNKIIKIKKMLSDWKKPFPSKFMI